MPCACFSPDDSSTGWARRRVTFGPLGYGLPELVSTLSAESLPRMSSDCTALRSSCRQREIRRCLFQRSACTVSSWPAACSRSVRPATSLRQSRPRRSIFRRKTVLSQRQYSMPVRPSVRSLPRSRFRCSPRPAVGRWLLSSSESLDSSGWESGCLSMPSRRSPSS